MLNRHFVFGLSLLIGTPSYSQETQQPQGAAEESTFEALKAGLEKKAQAVAEQWSKIPEGSQEGIIVGAEGAITLYGAVKYFSEKARISAGAEGTLQGVIAGAQQMAEDLRAQSPTGRAATALREAIEKTYGGNPESTVIKHVVRRPLVQVEFVPAGSLTKEVVTNTQERQGLFRTLRTVTTKADVPVLFDFEQHAVQGLEDSRTITVKIVHPEQWATHEAFGFNSKGVLATVNEIVDELEQKIAGLRSTRAFVEAMPEIPSRQVFFSNLQETSKGLLIHGHTDGLTNEILAYQRARTLRAGKPTGFTLSLRDGMRLEDVRLPIPAPAPRSSFLSKVGTGAKRLLWFYSAGDLCIRVGDLIATGESSVGLSAWDEAYYYCKDLSGYENPRAMKGF